MSDFLAWYSDPEVAEERREIQRTVRCTEPEAVLIQQMACLSVAMEELAAEVMALTPMDEEAPDDDPD